MGVKGVLNKGHNSKAMRGSGGGSVWISWGKSDR